jgi:hypothetical protein
MEPPSSSTDVRFDPSQAGWLFQPIQKNITQTQSEIQKAGEMFRGQADTGRVTGDTSQAAMDAALKDPGGASQLKSWLGASYTGPSGLDPVQVGGFQQKVADYSKLAQGLATGADLPGQISHSIVGLSPGEARFEATRLMGDPETRVQAGQLQQSTKDLQALLDREKEAATTYATQRKSEAEGLAKGTKEYLTGKRSSILDEVEKEIAAKNEAKTALQKEFETLMSGGDYTKLPPKFLEQIGANDFLTRRKEAESEWSKIMAKYPGISQQAVLQMPVYGGYPGERFSWGWQGSPPGGGAYPKGITGLYGKTYYMANEPPPGMDLATWNQVVKRQMDLEGLFGPGVERWSQGDVPLESAGKYWDVAPLYYKDYGGIGPPPMPIEMPAYNQYLGFSPGTGATQATEMTPERLQQLNMIEGLLGQPTTVNEAATYTAPEITLDTAGYLQQLENLVAQEQARIRAEKQREYSGAPSRANIFW